MQSVTRIRTEEPYRKMWDTFVYFENEQTASRYLRDQYEKSGLPEPQRAAYQATPKLIFGIKQARQYYRAAETCDIMTKPLLLYYGMMSLARALIACRDPDYPTTTSVLKHGLSTRKLKRDSYCFIQDEIRVQKDGLFVVLHEMLGGSRFSERQRVVMKDLLAVLPELIPCYQRLYGLPCVCEFEQKSDEHHTYWDLPRWILQARGYTREEFLNMLNRMHTDPSSQANRPVFYLQECDPPGRLHLHHGSPVAHHPLLIGDVTGKMHIRYPLAGDFLLPEISLHFMVMFVLGMLCRYETERWGEMILTFLSQDVYLINEFLNLSMRKFPNLILNELFGEQYIFYSV
ncbi:YaaC family protein [Effusibacillus pohliae]|uniref:YaaC family protein n=1 Tax=Effusibacillus pohliae TaxID=232270 RepID=UPI00036A7245|nr:YaaC family protein [Effusibacillus pohliae]